MLIGSESGIKGAENATRKKRKIAKLIDLSAFLGCRQLIKLFNQPLEERVSSSLLFTVRPIRNGESEIPLSLSLSLSFFPSLSCRAFPFPLVSLDPTVAPYPLPLNFTTESLYGSQGGEYE